MRNLYHQLLLSAMLLFCMRGMADIGHLYTPDKLSSGLITCICQDRYGYLWIGTEYGLNKFDGYRYTAYHHNRKDSTTISDNEVASLFVDKSGNLWVGGSKGLARYDYEHDCFKRYQFPDNRSPRVNSLIESATGDLLIGTAGYGLFSLKKGSEDIHYEELFCQRHIDDFCSRIHIDRNGNLWRSSHIPTITRYTLKNKKTASLRDYQSECGHPVGYIEYSPKEMLIVCMYGIMSYNYETEELQRADFDLTLLDRNVSIEGVTMDSQGNIYFATAGCGLMVIPKGERRMQRIENVTARIDMTSANVVDVIEDKDHNLWAAFYNKGLLLISKQKASFNSWSFSNQHYVTGGNVASVVQGEGEDIWCTVQNNGIYRLNEMGHIIEHPASPGGTRIMYRDRLGQYWLTTENTLYRFHPATRQAVMEKTFDGRGLNCMVDDGQGRLYICVFGMGLCIYDTHTHETQMVSMQQTHRSEGYLCNDWIKAMTFDSRGMLWIATTNGISMMNPEGLVFNSRGWNALLEGLQCYSVCETQNGDMLIGTESGLYRYSWKTNQVKEDPKAQLLNDRMICSMVRDSQGEIWISTTNGIWQYSDKRKQPIGYIGDNGLMAKEYILGAALHRSDDRIFFGTADGITTFRPQDINNRQYHLGKVYLTRFFCNGHSLNPLEDYFQLEYADNTFTLEFSLLDYQNTDNIVFQYRVNGSPTWMQTNEGANQITFTQLPPGQYFVEVRASSNGIFSEDVHTLHIIVLKPWYKSWWAYLIYMAIIMGFLALIVFNVERQRRRDLEESKMRFLINATHDIRSPLTMIMGPLEKLKKRLTDTESQVDLNTIDKNANRLLLLVNQILDERKIDKKQMRLSCKETDLTAFIRGIFKFYEYNAQQRNITVRFEYPEEPVKAGIDHTQFDKVISNLLSNAFKYTFDNGEVIVRLSQRTDVKQVAIEVIDSGVGFEDDKTERFFERFYQGKHSNDLHIDGTGIGLNLCRVLTEMHGGKISAANRTDGTSGAILTVLLPMGNKHLKPEEIEERQKVEYGAHHKKQRASRNFKVLIVDDDEEIGKYIHHELQEWYRFYYASNGKEGLKKLITNQYDLVITDVMMPVMDGISLLRAIKSNPKISDIPVILLTSKSEVSFRLEGLKKGADAFLAKPFAMEELHILIDNLVDNVRRLKGKYSVVSLKEEKVEDVEVKGNDEILMDKVVNCINEHLDDSEFDTEQLAKIIGVSRAHLHRKMKKMVGMTPGEFLRNIRMEQGARLIKEQKINVSQVAYAVGFNTQAHFSIVFKRYFGMNPKDYAMMHHVNTTEESEETTNHQEKTKKI